jgi:hypothetical protein
MFILSNFLASSDAKSQSGTSVATGLFSPFLINLIYPIGRTVNNVCQWIMVIYAANPESIIVPAVIIALGTVAFFFSMLDVTIDLFAPKETCFVQE